jgi:asparagine synthase (glutamine-hydrolysing)
MSATLRHRGPDGAGALAVGAEGGRSDLRGWLGHRRLRILDLTEAAHQPMLSPDHSVAVVFNGEIYNFVELRAVLDARGHRFRSTGDTEVLLAAYLEWGAECVSHLDGMFAFAIWDGRISRLLLARDRVGKKPLYYAERGGVLVFGSEIKALLACPWVHREPAWSKIPGLLTLGYLPSPETAYEGIEQVPPGSIVEFGLGGIGIPRRYWTPPEPVQLHVPPEQFDERTRELLAAAVRRRMASDVPLGALLSGGIDSSIVVGLMTRENSAPIRTFSAGFPEDATFDERSHARKVASLLGTEHTEFAISLEASALIDHLLWHHDQPYGDSSAIPTYLIARLARQHVTVVLTGDGGDEVFGGYARFQAAKLAQTIPPQLGRLARRLVRFAPSTGGYFDFRRRAERFVGRAGLPLFDQYLSWISIFNDDTLAELSTNTCDGASFFPAAVRQWYDAAAPLPPLDRLLYVNFMTYLPDDIAVKLDRTTMAASLEARSPFLDTAVIEHLAARPAREKVGLRQVKPLVRRAFEPLLPAEIWNRPKHGFSIPVDLWFRGELGEAFCDEVLAPDARTSRILDQGSLRAIWSEHISGERAHGNRLWLVLMVERWLRGCERPLALMAPEPVHVVDGQSESP